MKISNTYPELNLNWLVCGRGPMTMTNDAPTPPNDIHNNQVFIGNWDGLAEVLKTFLQK